MAQDVSLRWGGRARARSLRRAGGVLSVVIDIDGCMTDGRLYVDNHGNKPMKAFGPDDHAAIVRWRRVFDILFITSDEQQMVKERAAHMDTTLVIAPANVHYRLERIRAEGCKTINTVYIGDGYHDAEVMGCVAFGIAPADAWPGTMRAADAVTSRDGGRRAVAQALDFIGKKLQ